MTRTYAPDPPPSTESSAKRGGKRARASKEPPPPPPPAESRAGSPTRPLDELDRKLLAALQQDARRSNKELAARVGLAPSTTLARVRRLERDGVLRGAHAEVDPEALGIGLQAMVIVRLQAHSRDTVRAFHAMLRELPEVVSTWYVGGVDDFLVHVAVRDTRHLHDLLMDRITNREEVATVRTELVFEHARKVVLPSW